MRASARTWLVLPVMSSLLPARAWLFPLSFRSRINGCRYSGKRGIQSPRLLERAY